ncbi:hypothetical protein [Sphingomonas sp. S2M10]|nr:hypothetical protein [Sphingomonas sp. S2M10]
MQLDEIWCIMVQGGPSGMAHLKHQKRFTVSVDQADYDALQQLCSTATPPVNLQYVMRLAVRNLLEQHASRQLTFPLERRP